MKKSPNATITSEEDMDVGQSTIPEPTAVLTERKRVSMRMPPPKSQSPIKTFLKSPARRHPSLGPASSPTRGSIVSPVRVRPQPPVVRRLDFSTDDLGGHSSQRLGHSPPKKMLRRTSITQSPATKNMHDVGHVPGPLKPAFHSYEETQEYMQENRAFDLDSSHEYDDYQPMNHDDQDVGSPERQKTETPPELTPPRPSKKRGRPSLKKSAKHNKAGPPKMPIDSTTPAEEYVAKEKLLVVEEEYEQDEPEEERPAKMQRGSQKPNNSPKIRQKAPLKTKPKSSVKRQESPPKDSSPVQIQHGPPRPRQKGLCILRREPPGLGTFATTRSGRASVKPVAYWKNESVVYGEDETADGDESFLLPTLKEVIRVEDVEERKSRNGKKRAPKARKREEEHEEEEEEISELWESEPGRIYGNIRTWNPEDPVGAESSEREDEIAFSNAAIMTREIPGSTVKFAKTLTLPFFGSGMVDLPPGASKKLKNSRRMQMIFFMHYGRVNVTVNDTSFRIGKGGMWQVPRGEVLHRFQLGSKHCANFHTRQFL